MLLSGNNYSGEKYFIGYFYNDYKVKSFYIMPPKRNKYAKSYDGDTKWMYFLIEDDDLLEKYNTIWNPALIQKKQFHSEPVYNKKILKTEIKSHGNEVTDFYDKEIPKVDSNHAVINLNSAVKKD